MNCRGASLGRRVAGNIGILTEQPAVVNPAIDFPRTAHCANFRQIGTLLFVFTLKP